jgi:hypothetical protein
MAPENDIPAAPPIKKREKQLWLPSIYKVYSRNKVYQNQIMWDEIYHISTSVALLPS